MLVTNVAPQLHQRRSYFFALAAIRTLALQLTPVLEHEARVLEIHGIRAVVRIPHDLGDELARQRRGPGWRARSIQERSAVCNRRYYHRHWRR